MAIAWECSQIRANYPSTLSLHLGAQTFTDPTRTMEDAAKLETLRG